MKKYYETNKVTWNDKVETHVQSDFYRLDDFMNGWNSLKSIELEALGDVSNKSMLHLQCHFGQDTLSWERLGATVTGVDFSDEAIKKARELTVSLGMKARFIECNVLELDQYLDEQFDIVFTSYGTICWLHDLEKWASIVNRFLKKGGIFLIADFHPVLNMFDWEQGQIEFPYFYNTKPDFEDIVGTYADNEANIQGREYFWFHPVSKVISLLLAEQLELLSYQEFPFSPYDCFPNMDKIKEDHYVFNKTKHPLPHTFCLKFKK